MKRVLIVLFCLQVTSSMHSQSDTCTCAKDLTVLNEKIQSTPAYKINKKDYERTYTQLSEKVSSAVSAFDCFSLLNELMLSLNDNHSRI